MRTAESSREWQSALRQFLSFFHIHVINPGQQISIQISFLCLLLKNICSMNFKKKSKEIPAIAFSPMVISTLKSWPNICLSYYVFKRKLLNSHQWFSNHIQLAEAKKKNTFPEDTVKPATTHRIHHVPDMESLKDWGQPHHTLGGWEGNWKSLDDQTERAFISWVQSLGHWGQ